MRAVGGLWGDERDRVPERAVIVPERGSPLKQRILKCRLLDRLLDEMDFK